MSTPCDCAIQHPAGRGPCGMFGPSAPHRRPICAVCFPYRRPMCAVCFPYRRTIADHRGPSRRHPKRRENGHCGPGVGWSSVKGMAGPVDELVDEVLALRRDGRVPPLHRVEAELGAIEFCGEEARATLTFVTARSRCSRSGHWRRPWSSSKKSSETVVGRRSSRGLPPPGPRARCGAGSFVDFAHSGVVVSSA